MRQRRASLMWTSGGYTLLLYTLLFSLLLKCEDKWLIVITSDGFVGAQCIASEAYCRKTARGHICTIEHVYYVNLRHIQRSFHSCLGTTYTALLPFLCTYCSVQPDRLLGRRHAHQIPGAVRRLDVSLVPWDAVLDLWGLLCRERTTVYGKFTRSLWYFVPWPIVRKFYIHTSPTLTRDLTDITM